MPKTGSQTVEATVQSSGLPHSVVRVHSLSSRRAVELRNRLKAGDADPGWQQNARQSLRKRADLTFALRARRMLRACGIPIPALRVITSVRDLVGGALSSIFENYHLFAASPELLTAGRCSELLRLPNLTAYLRDWFDEELRPFVGVDVYAKPFSTTALYCTYTNKFARVLLYRFDLLPTLGPVLADFLQAPVERIVNRNVGNSKPYADAYRKAQQQLRLPETFVWDLLQSKPMRHFYSSEERAVLRSRWCQESESAEVSSDEAIPVCQLPVACQS